jgi:hypothetical protein
MGATVPTHTLRAQPEFEYWPQRTKSSRLANVSSPGRHKLPFPKFIVWVLPFAIVATLFVVLTNRGGKSAWERYKSEMAARGVNLDWRAVHPPALPPDNENFASVPLIKALGVRGETDPVVYGRLTALPIYKDIGYTGDLEMHERTDLKAIQSRLRGRAYADVFLPPLPQDPAADVLLALKPMESEFNQFRDAATRPRAQIQLEFPDPISAQMPNFVALRELAQVFNMKAIAELRLRRVDEAFADNRVIFRLADASRSSPNLVCSMIYCAINGLVDQPFWEGWVADQWTDQQLLEFQNLFSRVDLLSAYDTGLRGERARINYCMEVLVRTNSAKVTSAGGGDLQSRLLGLLFRVGGFEQSSQLTANTFMDAFVFPNYSVREQRVYPSKSRENSDRLNRSISRWRPSTYLAGIAIPNFLGAFKSVAHNQTYANLSLVVCALERYRRARGQYPESLDLLAPQYVQKLPRDLITGQPLKYRRTDDGKFLLYSVGWDEKDHGGVRLKDTGDWVWPVRAKD